MSLSPDRKKILGEYFKSQGMSKPNTRSTVAEYENTAPVFTECAKIRGSRPYNYGGRVLFRGTRGSPAQVMNGTVHHTCSGKVKSDFIRDKKTKRIVSKAKRAAGLKSWKNMSKETKAKFLANRFKKKTHNYNLRPGTRVNYKGM